MKAWSFTPPLGEKVGYGYALQVAQAKQRRNQDLELTAELWNGVPRLTRTLMPSRKPDLDTLVADVLGIAPRLKPEKVRAAIAKLAIDVSLHDPVVASASTEGDSSGEETRAGPYIARPDGIYVEKTTVAGVTEVRLSNFTARIVAEELHDDGAEQTTVFTIEARLHDARPLLRVSVPAGRFPSMSWVTEYYGNAAIVSAGQSTKDHLRAAIQWLSPDVERCTVYAHTGWRRLGDDWVYFHADGAIGPFGPVPDIAIDLPTALHALRLPAPSKGDAQQAAIRASLDVLTVAPSKISVPLLCATYRGPLGEAIPSDLTVFVAGASGQFKTELTALAMAHYGAEWSGRHLPASWTSTANHLEKLAFQAKDTLLVIDDFAPVGTATDIQVLNGKAERLIRGQGNRAGRGRMAADGRLRPDYVSRALLLSSGEDVPRGQSLRARMLVIELSPGDVDKARLSEAQGRAVMGVYATALSGYVAYLSSRLDTLKKELPERLRCLRDRAASGGHARTADIVASLYIGWETFLAFAYDAGALDEPRYAELLTQGWSALTSLGAAQSEHQRSEDVTSQFLRLVAGAIVAGWAHVADARTGAIPDDATRWGWAAQSSGPAGLSSMVPWQARGAMIGWLDGDQLLLDPDVAYAVAQRFARDQGTSVPVTPRTLWKRLAERQLLASLDTARGRNLVRWPIGGVRRVILHLNAETICPPESGPNGPNGPTHGSHQRKDPSSGPKTWAASGDQLEETAQRNGPDQSAHQSTDETSGPFGPFGPLIQGEPPPRDTGLHEDLFAGLGADAALARALAHKLTSQPTASALAEQWHSVQTGNYHTLSDDAQRLVRLAYETRGRQLVEGGQR